MRSFKDNESPGSGMNQRQPEIIKTKIDREAWAAERALTGAEGFLK